MRPHGILHIKLLRVVLWLIRLTRSDLQWEHGRVIYRWVFSHDGSFDHWFDTPEGPRAVTWCRTSLTRPAVYWILLHTKLSLGPKRRLKGDIIHERSETYYCTAPLYATRHACKRSDFR